MRRKNSHENISQIDYGVNRNNFKNIESNQMTPLPSNKISRANSRHSANPNYD